MARPVVAGSDGSQESLQAVEWAAAEAVRHSAPLRIVTVAAPSCPADEEDPAARLDELMHTVYAQSLRTAASGTRPDGPRCHRGNRAPGRPPGADAGP